MSVYVWLLLSPEESLHLREALNKRTSRRERIMESLSAEGLDFVINFKDLFSVDNPKICSEFLAGSTEFVFQYNGLLGGAVGAAGIIETVENKVSGKTLIMKSILLPKPLGYLSLRVLDYPVGWERANPSLQHYLVYNQFNKRKVLVLANNNFVNQTCLHLILNSLLKDNPNYLHQYDAFVCGNKGYNLTEYANRKTVHEYLEAREVTDALLADIFRQVLGSLSILKGSSHSFCHADLKAKNIFATSEDRIWENEEEVEEVTRFMLADFDKSSITYSGFRFYNNIGDYRVSNSPFRIVTGTDPKFDRYVVSSTVIPLQVYTMHNPFGMYISYDIYTLVLSLFAIPSVWQSFVNYQLPHFSTLFAQLWTQEQYNTILKYLSKSHQDLSKMRNISRMLSSINAQLLIDVDFFYTEYNVRPPATDKFLQQIVITESSGGHICIDSCSSHGKSYNFCHTNPYSSKLGEYNWDYCSH